MWVATFKIIDSNRERNLKNMAFPSCEGKQPSHDMMGATCFQTPPPVWFVSKCKSEKEGPQPGSVPPAGADLQAAFKDAGSLTLSRMRPLPWTEATEQRAPQVWDSPTSPQLQNTACCSLARWSSSKPTAGGPITPESVYLSAKWSTRWAAEQEAWRTGSGASPQPHPRYPVVL